MDEDYLDSDQENDAMCQVYDDFTDYIDIRLFMINVVIRRTLNRLYVPDIDRLYRRDKP
jgi:hypothetical protein